MRNKILIILISLFIVLAVVFAGISLSRQDAPPETTDNDIVLIWWNLFEPAENVQPLIDAYQAKNPKVTIKYVFKDISAYKQELDENLNDNIPINTPDIFSVHNSWSGIYQKLAIEAPSDILTNEDIDEFYPIVKADFYNNGIYGLPMYLDSLALIYDNNKLTQKGYSAPSTNWSDFVLQTSNLTQKDNTGNITLAGFSAYHPNNCQFSFEMINLLLLQNGVRVLDEQGRSQLEKQSSAYGAFEFYRDFTSSGSNIWSSDMKIDIAAFLEGNLAIYAAPSWRLINIINYNNKYNLNLDVRVAPIPQLAGQSEVFWPTYWGLMVSKETKYSKEAWDFIKFITQEEQLKLLDQTIRANGRPIGIIYPRIKMYDLNKDDPFLGVYADSLKNARNWNMKDGESIKKVFEEALKDNWELKKLDDSLNEVLSSN